MQPSGEVGRFEVDDQPSPPADRCRYLSKAFLRGNNARPASEFAANRFRNLQRRVDSQNTLPNRLPPQFI